MNAVTKHTPAESSTAIRPVLVPQTFDQLVRFAEMAAVSGLVPRDYVNKPGAIMLAVQMGSELGLSPMQSITSIAVIGNRPGVFGDALIGLCRQSPLCQDIVETIGGEGDNRTAVCVATRRGATPITSRFSVADAKKAGLWGKSGPWSQYPDRMLQNRARGFSLRDAFPDVLRGLKTVEELRDTPPDDYRGTTLDHQPEPARAAPPRPDATVYATAAQPSSPTQPRKKTAREWMTELDAKLADCADEGAVMAIAASREVTTMLSTLKNGALTELQSLLAEAMERVQGQPHTLEGEVEYAPEPEAATAADDTFPGDR